MGDTQKGELMLKDLAKVDLYDYEYRGYVTKTFFSPDEHFYAIELEDNKIILMKSLDEVAKCLAEQGEASYDVGNHRNLVVSPSIGRVGVVPGLYIPEELKYLQYRINLGINGQELRITDTAIPPDLRQRVPGILDSMKYCGSEDYIPISSAYWTPDDLILRIGDNRFCEARNFYGIEELANEIVELLSQFGDDVPYIDMDFDGKLVLINSDKEKNGPLRGDVIHMPIGPIVSYIDMDHVGKLVLINPDKEKNYPLRVGVIHMPIGPIPKYVEELTTLVNNRLIEHQFIELKH